MLIADYFSQLFGAVVGGIFVLYIFGRILEWAILNRILKNKNQAIIFSSMLGLIAVFLLWAARKTEVVNFSIFSFFIAAILLPFIRIQWAKRKIKQQAEAK